MPDNTSPRLELSLPQIVAGALAAASAAVASSWLGVAGTVFGAVVVSVIATVGTALYTHSLVRSQYAIKETIPVLAPRSRADRDPVDAPQRRPISWSTVFVSCVATLALGFGILTGFEAAMGRSASELTGSGSGADTTLSSLVGGGTQHSSDTTPGKPSTPTSGGAPTTPTPTSPATTGPTPTTPTSTSPTSPTTTGPTSTGPTSTAPTSTSPTSTPTG